MICEELSTIIVLNSEALSLIMSEDPLERALMGCNTFGNAEAYEMVELLITTGVFMCKGEFDPLNRPPGPSPRPSIKDVPKLELKALPFHLKYFFGDDDTLLIILSVGLSDVQVKEELEVLKNEKNNLIANVKHPRN